MKCVRSSKLCTILISTLVLLFFASCAGKESLSKAQTNAIQKKWETRLKRSLPSIKAWGEVAVDVGTKKYRTDMALNMEGERLRVQFLDPVGGAWWQLKSRGEQVIVKNNDKIEKGEGEKFIKDQLGVKMSMNELRSIIAGRPLISRRDKLIYKRGKLKGGDLIIEVKGDVIKKWKYPRFEVVPSNYVKIDDKKFPQNILIKRRRGPGKVLIKYNRLNID